MTPDEQLTRTLELTRTALEAITKAEVAIATAITNKPEEASK